MLDELKARYSKISIGYSDHTMGLAVPLAAVSKGAVVLEKHFTLSQRCFGSDARHSTEPEDFKRLVDEVRQTEIALSSSIDKNQKVKSLKKHEMTLEKSIVASKSINESKMLEFEDLAFKKPGDGIPAKDYQKLLGKKMRKSVKKDHKFNLSDFE